jgi:hypothetical protein
MVERGGDFGEQAQLLADFGTMTFEEILAPGSVTHW